ncbi:MAG: glucuronate isomerase [Oscillospiraceae bacterium]|nr:glucuronate isomerase [Oscillospiraceae bacterium]
MDFLNNENFLLTTKTAQELYHDCAAGLPIIDWHCHLSARDIALNVPCGNLSQMWLAHDHYKWRAMRTLGVDEFYITGFADDWDKFEKWAACVPKLIGNPLYQWTHLELRRFFGIHESLSPETAASIYARANEQLAHLNVRDLMTQSNVKLVCTTDDPAHTLKWHKKLLHEFRLGTFGIRVLPAFRADNLIATYHTLKRELDEDEFESAANDLVESMRKRANAFDEMGCRAADFSSKSVYPSNKIVAALGDICREKDWVLEMHLSVLRNANSVLHHKIGRDVGGDIIAQMPDTLLNSLLTYFRNMGSNLPKTLIFSLNPTDNAALCALCGAFGDRLRQGSAWWFNDSYQGMRDQLTTYASMLPLTTFPGFVTDSRSFLSYPRHEYFRRIFCAFIGDMVEQGQYPNDKKALEEIVRAVCYESGVEFFGF